MSAAGALPPVNASAQTAADGSQINLHDALSTLGWQQGAKLPSTLTADVVWSQGARGAVPDDDMSAVFLVSQDCDVLHSRLDHEPVVEVVRATVLRSSDVEAQYKNLRHPRLLHLPATKGERNVGVAVSVLDRGLLPRQLLRTERPCKKIELDAPAVRRLAAFIARRYVRTARPDELDKRLGKKLLDKLGALLVDHSDNVDEIYLAVPIEQHIELPLGVPYKCTVFVVMSTKLVAVKGVKYAGRLGAQLEGRIDEMLQAANCAGIEFEATQHTFREQIMLSELDDMYPLDLGWPHFVADEEREAMRDAEDARRAGPSA